MECVFLSKGRAAMSEELVAADDAEAIEQAKRLFVQCSDRFDGYEIRDGLRVVWRHGQVGSDAEGLV